MSEGLIDERVVEMRFDNADFEQNVNQSIKTINKLKESLDFDNAGESFENISAAAAKCDMKPLEESLDGITVKFNMLEMVAANVLGRIVNKALDAGAAMVKSLTIDQLTSGWGKYEQKTQAVQTIIAATGESIDYINGKLEKLIWFADETSYDFVDMVNNIGKFTSAGIDLDKSVDSMMGISNWAAQSGAGIQQASRAMYNLSQAIGMGYVGIQDWKSIELANMATREFKQTVIDTAVRLGTLKQAADGTITTLNGKYNVTAENMRSSLKEQWFTSDVLTDALSEYNEFANKVYEVQKSMGISANDAMEWLEEMGEDMDSLSAQAFKHAQEAMTFNQVIAATSDAVSSGWMRTFELIFGNYNQAKKLWTDLANDMWDVFAGSAENRNDLLKSVMSSEYQKMIEELPDGADFEYRLTQTIKEIGIKNGKTAEEMERLLTKYDTFEELLKTKDLQDFISNDTLEIAFSKVGDEYIKDAKAAADLSEKLKSQNNLLKNVVIGLANGYYGKEEEAARKKLESMGWTNFEYLEQLAEAYKYGLDISWDQETKDLIEALDTQKAVCDEFTKYLSKLNPFGSFFDSLRSLGGREKLIGGFQNIIDSFKNFYLLIIEIKNGLEYLFHVDSFFSGLIDGFYNLTSIFRFSSDAFEAFQELVNEFFHGGIQKKIDEFLYGKQGKRIGQQWDALTDTMEPVFEHVPGLIENVSNAYHKYIERLPKETAASIEAVRVKIFGFFSSISEKYEKWKTDIFGTKIEVIDATDPKNVKTYFQYTGGLINEWKEKISNFFLNSLPGKAVSGLVTILQKISNYLFGYEDETQKIEGKLAPIFDKVTAFINMLKTIGKTIREFLFGKDFNQTGFGQAVHIPGLIEKVKTSVDSFVKSDTFQTIKRFFFGEKDAEGKVIKNNIFGKIGTAIDLFKSKIDILVQSAAFQAVKRFFFGEKDAEGKVIKNNIFGKIGTAIDLFKSKIDILVQSAAFQAIKRFFFGEKDAEGNPIKNNIFGKIGTAITFLKSKIDILVQSDTFQAIKHFIFGDEQTNTPSIFEKIKQKIEDITGSIAKIFNFGGEENGLNIVLGIFNGIIEGIKNVKDWIKKHIFDPFVEGFKSVFGIHSPAEEMKPLGENILLGILQGILNVAKSIGIWVKEHIFKPIKNAISSAVKDFLNNTSIGNEIKKIIDRLNELKKSIDKIAESNTFKTIKRFFFGEKDAEGNPIKNNIFGKIGTAITFLKSKIDILVQSEAFKTIKRFFFGEKDAEGNPIKNNIFGKIGTAIKFLKSKIDILVQSEAFKTIKRFFFGEKDAEGNPIKNNIFGKIGTAIKFLKSKIDILVQSDTFQNIKKFILGDEGTDTPNIFGKIGIAVENFRKKISNLPEYLQNAKNSLELFFLGKKKYTGKSWDNENQKWIDHYIYEGSLIDRLKEKFEKLKADHPWLASFCSFIETQIQNISKIFSDAQGNISLALENLNTYLFGGKFKHKDEFGNITEDLKETNGVIKDIRTNIEKLFNGGKEKSEKSFLEQVADILGIGRGRNIFDQIRGFFTTLTSLNIFLLTANFKFGDFLGFEIQSGLEAFIDSFKALAITLAILAGTIVGLTFFVNYLQTKGFRTLIGAFGIVVALLGALAGFAILLSKTKAEIKASTAVVLLVGSITVTLISAMIMLLTGMFFSIVALLAKFNLMENHRKELIAAGAILTILLTFITLITAFSVRVAKKDEKIKSASGVWFGMAAVLFGLAHFITTVAFLVGAFYLLTRKMEDSELGKLKDAGKMVLGLVGFALALVGVIAALSALASSGKNANRTTFAIVTVMLMSINGLIITIAALLAGLYFLMKEKTLSDLKTPMLVLSGILLSITAMIGVLLLAVRGLETVAKPTDDSKDKAKKIDKSIFGLLIVISLMIERLKAVVSVLAGVGAITGWENLAIAFGGIALLLLTIAGVTAIIANIKGIDKSVIGTIGTMFMVIAAIGGLILLVIGLSENNASISKLDTMITPFVIAIGEIILLIGAVSGLLWFLKTVSINQSGKEAVSTFLRIALVLSALGLVTRIVYVFSENGNFADVHTQILPIILAMGEVVALVAAMALILKLLAGSKIEEGDITALYEVIGAVAVLAAITVGLIAGITYLQNVIIPITKDKNISIDFENAPKILLPLVEAIGELVLLMIPLTILLKQLKKVEVTPKDALVLFEMAGVLFVLAGIAGVLIQGLSNGSILSNIGDWKTAWKNLVPLMEVIAELSVMMTFLSVPMALIAKAKVGFKTPFIFLAWVGVLVAIAATIAVLINNDWVKSVIARIPDLQTISKGLLSIAAVLSGLIVALTALMLPLFLLKTIKPDWSAIGQIGVLVLFISVLAAASIGLLYLTSTLPNEANWNTLLQVMAGIVGLTLAIGAAILVLGGVNAAVKNWKLNIDLGKISVLLFSSVAIIGETILLFVSLAGILNFIDSWMQHETPFGIIEAIQYYVNLITSIGEGFIAVIGSLAGAIVICGLISAAANNFDSFNNIDFKKVAGILVKSGLILAELIGIFVGLSAVLNLIRIGIGKIPGASDDWLEEAVDFFADIMDKFSGTIFKFGIAIGLLSLGLIALSKIKIPSGEKGISIVPILAFIGKAVVIFEAIILAIAAIGTLTRKIEDGGKKLGLDDGWIGKAFDFVANLLTKILGGIGSAIHALVDGLRGEKGDKTTEAIDIGTKLGTFMESLKPFLNAIKNLSLADVTQVGILSAIMVGVFTSEFFERAAEWVSTWQTGAEIETVVGDLAALFGESGPFTSFLSAISELSAANIAQVNMLSAIMKQIFTSEFYEKAAEWVSTWQTGTSFKDVLSDLGTLFGNGASLTVFLTKLNDLSMDNVADVKAFTTIMKELCGSVFFKKVAEWISKWKTKTDFSDVLKDLGTLFGSEASLTVFLGKLKDLSLDDVARVTAFTTIMGELMASEFFNKAAEWMGTWKTGGDYAGMLNDLISLFGDEAPLTEFLGKLKDLSLDDVASVTAFTTIMSELMASEFFIKASEWMDSWKTGGDYPGMLKDLISLFGDEAPLTEFLGKIKGLSENGGVADVTAFTGIMEELLKSTFFNKASTWIKSWETGTTFDGVLADLSSLFGEKAPLTSFLACIKEVGAPEGPKADVQALADIMESIFESTLFTKAASWVGTWNTNGGDLTTVLESLGSMVGEDAPLNKFLERLDTIDPEYATKAEYIPKILGAVFGSQLLTGGVKLTQWISDSTDYTELFKNLTRDTGVLDGVAEFSKKIDKLTNAGVSFNNVGKVADSISAVFGLLKAMTNIAEIKEDTTFLDTLTFWNKEVSLTKVGEALTGIKTKIVDKIVEFQEAMKTSGIDADYIRYTIGTYLDLINTVMTLGTTGNKEIDISSFAEIGNFVVQGLVLALSDDANQTAVKTAAINLGEKIKEGLKFALDEHSPSKEAYTIGEFVAQGLTNGLLAGEPLTWRMAREFGEGTVEALMDGAKKYKAYGLTKHAINMVTSDLLDENIFNMPDFSSKNRFGNADVDFEAMANWLHEKFDEEFGPEYVNSFVGSYKQTMAEINQVINDEDYAKIITGIGAGDFGLSEDTIIKKLTEELGSLDAAKLAWQDYNDVKEGTLKINQDLLKQQKQDPPMTLEQYMEMLRKEQEDYNRVLSGEFDTLAAQNGTTRFEEMKKAGIDAWHMQQRLDRDFSENMHPMTQEEIEAYVYAKAQEQALTAAVEENADATQNVVTVTTENAQASADAASELKNQTDATNELADANNNLTSSASEIPHNYVFDAEMLDLMNREQAEVVGLAEVTDTLTDSVSAAAASMDEKNETLTDQTAKTEEAAQAAQDAANATKDMAEATKDAAAARQIDYKAADAAITAIQNGTAATEEQLAALKALKEETITYGTFDKKVGDNLQNRKMGWADNGISSENIAYFFSQYDLATVNLDKLNAKLKETEKNVKDTTNAAKDAGAEINSAFSGIYDILPSSIKSITDVFSSGYDKESGGINLKLSDFLEVIPDDKIPDSLKGIVKSLASDFSIDLPVELKIPKDADVKDYVGRFVSGMFSDFNDAAGTYEFSIEKTIGFITTALTGKKTDLASYFADGAKAVADLGRKADSTKQSVDELNSSLSNTGKDFPQIDYAQKYIQQVDEAVASHGYKRLQEGVRLNQKEAAELQKIWYNAVQGSYGSDFVEHLKENFGIDWDELNRVITPSGHFNPEKVNPYLEYADSLLGNEDYKTENLFQDILDGKFGSDKDRKEALETLGYDYDKIQDKLNKYRRGEMTWEELVDLGDSYGKVTDEEKKYAKEHEELLKTLNTTPEGAFRSIADFLDGVTSVLKDPKTSKNFTDFINEVVGSLETMSLPNASQFEIVGNFLTAVRNTARESSGIAKDFKDFVDGIKGSVEELGTITIDNPDGLNQVVDFLNKIKIDNQDVLEAVSSFIGNIVEFATGANAGGDYSTKLVEAIGRIEYAINHLDVNPDKAKPITQFLDELTKAAGLLENGSDNIIQTFINNFYGALESSTSQASNAASTIAKTIKDVFEKEYNPFQRIGRELIVKLCLGILQVQTQALSAANTIASAIMTGIKDGAVNKAGQAGNDFVTNLVGGLTSEDSKAKIKEALGQIFGEAPEEKPKVGSRKMTLKKEEKEEVEENTEEIGGSISEGGAGTTEGTQYGQNFVSGMAAAIEKGGGTVETSLNTMFSGITEAAGALGGISDTASTSLETLASTLTNILADDEEGSLMDAIHKLRDEFASIAPDGYSIGANTALGIVRGLAEKSKYVSIATKLLAKGIVFTYDDVLKIASPSKLMFEHTGYVIDGIVNGLHAGESAVNHQMADVATGVIDQFSSAIAAASDVASSELNLDPVITPVIDMSEVTRAASDIDAALSTNRAIDISTAERSKYTADSNNPQNQPGSQTFIQNNYSPKPLSRLEIYRQTRNQFAMLKGAYVQST